MSHSAESRDRPKRATEQRPPVNERPVHAGECYRREPLKVQGLGGPGGKVGEARQRIEPRPVFVDETDHMPERASDKIDKVERHLLRPRRTRSYQPPRPLIELYSLPSEAWVTAREA